MLVYFYIICNDVGAYIAGGFAFSGGAKFADYTGRVVGEVLAGEWEDFRGCSGSWRAEKA